MAGSAERDALRRSGTPGKFGSKAGFLARAICVGALDRPLRRECKKKIGESNIYVSHARSRRSSRQRLQLHAASIRVSGDEIRESLPPAPGQRSECSRITAASQR